MNGLLRAVLILVTMSPTAALAQNRPIVYGGCGGPGFRPNFGPRIPGWNVPRLYPSIGSGFGFVPWPPPIRVDVFYNPYPVFAPPIIYSPIVEPIDLSLPPIDPPVGPAAGRFRPIGPQDRDRARQPAPAARLPEAPAVEHDRLVRTGKAAFAAGEYGRAAENFQRALRALPDRGNVEPLLAQAWIALGKYADAATAIHRGVRQNPAWPGVGPRLIELYGPRQDEWTAHRRQLQDASETWPEDLAIQFLRAYSDWFEGPRDDARRRFEKLRPLVADAAIIARFLETP